MLYNGMSRGFNGVLWDPHLMLLTMYIHMRAIQHSTNMRDIGISKSFLNFMMHKSLRNFYGLDVTHIRMEDARLI